MNAGHAVVMHRECRHLAERLDHRPERLGGREPAERKAHRVEGRVGDLDGALQRRVEVRFEAERLGRRQPASRDARLAAGREELLAVRHVLVVDPDEEPVVLLERSRRHVPQQLVLRDALHGGLGVVDGVAGAAVEQSVVPPGGTGGDLAAFDEGDPEAPEDQVEGQGATGASPADDHDVRGGRTSDGGHDGLRPGPAGPGSVSRCLGDYSTHSKVRVTAFFQSL